MTQRTSLDTQTVAIPVRLLREFVQWFAENDGRAADFGRLFFVAEAEDILDGIDPALRPLYHDRLDAMTKVPITTRRMKHGLRGAYLTREMARDVLDAAERSRR